MGLVLLERFWERIYMKAYDLILKKRNGDPLGKEELEFLVEGYVKEKIPDYQIAAFLMALFFRGMTSQELTDFTQIMASSGDMMDLSSIPGIKVDKHSTGGVGDKTTLILAPLVAAAGVPVAKVSGRCLGHTGGTIDKLSSIQGFKTELPVKEFLEKVRERGLAVVGQAANLVPADKKLYALRDVTATVDSIPLIASSIMSKKLASGAKGLVLDVKVGKGAFLKTREEARELARAMVDTGNRAGLKTVALLTDMNQPLGKAVGNALEVKEAVATLMGRGPDDLTHLCLALGSHMLVLGGKVKTPERGRKILEEILYSGKGLEKFRELIEGQGGKGEIIDKLELLPLASHIKIYEAPQRGFIKEINALKVGKAAMALGAGREKKEDPIDLSVGIELSKKGGEWVEKGEPLFFLHSNHKHKEEEALEILKDAISLTKEETPTFPLIYEEVY